MVEQHTQPLVSLADAERRAVSLLPPMVLGYYASGAEDETTLTDNLASWRRWRILPRVLVDVSRVDTRAALCFFFSRRCRLLFQEAAAPLCAHPGGSDGNDEAGAPRG